MTGRLRRLRDVVRSIEVRPSRGTPCRAALNVAGEHFPCVEPSPHGPLAHRNPDARAIWISAAEHDEIDDLQRRAREAGL